MHRSLIVCLALLAGCKLSSSLTGGGSASLGPSTPTTPTSAPAHEAPVKADPALSELATRFVGYINELKQSCPAGPKPPSSAYGPCIRQQRETSNLYERVEEKSHPQVADGKRFLVALGESVRRWEADESAEDQRQARVGKASSELSRASHNASNLIQHLEAARAGKMYTLLTSFEHRDAGYVQGALARLTKQMPALAEIESLCAAGAGEPTLCEIATQRDALFTKFLGFQFEGIVKEQLQNWRNVVERIDHEGEVAVINYNKLQSLSQLEADLGKRLAEIAKVLEQKNTAAAIKTALAKLQTDFHAAIRAKASVDAWQQHARDAKHSDPVVTRGVRTIDGLTVVRALALSSTWGVTRGINDQPKERYKAVWALMKKPGEAFCRLYPLTVIQDHLGGGRYSSPHVNDGFTAEFYISRCK